MRAALLICFLLLPSAVHAEMSFNELLRLYAEGDSDSKALVKRIIESNENGMSWMNSFLTFNGEQAVYCPPSNVAFSGEQVMDIVKREIKTTADLGNQPYGLAILLAMRKSYPCPAKTSKAR
jgi:hypothetical protein